jgi:hypothetical protein
MAHIYTTHTAYIGDARIQTPLPTSPSQQIPYTAWRSRNSRIVRAVVDTFAACGGLSLS